MLSSLDLRKLIFPRPESKPLLGEKDNVYIVRIPNSDHAVRFFDGGLKSRMMWGLDFYDFKSKKAVKSSLLGYSVNIVPVPSTLSVMCSGPLTSWEHNNFIEDKDISIEHERFNMPEGCVCALTKAGQVLFYFESPRRDWNSWKRNVAFVECVPARECKKYY
jgi:hypothetical protein